MLKKVGVLGGGGWHRDVLDDPTLELFLEKRIAGYLGVERVDGEGHCLELEKAINDLIASDPRGFEQLLEKLLMDYVRKYLHNEEAQDKAVKELMRKLKEKGPPDKLQRARETVAEVWRR